MISKCLTAWAKGLTYPAPVFVIPEFHLDNLVR